MLPLFCKTLSCCSRTSSGARRCSPHHPRRRFRETEDLLRSPADDDDRVSQIDLYFFTSLLKAAEGCYFWDVRDFNDTYLHSTLH